MKPGSRIEGRVQNASYTTQPDISKADFAATFHGYMGRSGVRNAKVHPKPAAAQP